MPFKKRDGDYYFEAVELFGDGANEHAVHFVALCPLCAAMYKEFVKYDKSTSEQLKRALRTSTSNPIALQLGDKSAKLRFVETHWHDLRTLLNKE